MASFKTRCATRMAQSPSVKERTPARVTDPPSGSSPEPSPKERRPSSQNRRAPPYPPAAFSESLKVCRKRVKPSSESLSATPLTVTTLYRLAQSESHVIFTETRHGSRDSRDTLSDSREGPDRLHPRYKC